MLTNAIKFQVDGKLVHVTLEEVMKSQSDKLMLVVRVMDDGVGLKAHEVESVFKQFKYSGKFGNPDA